MTNNNFDIIDQLVSEHKIVKPLESVRFRFFKWIFSACICVLAGISTLGLRSDWAIVFSSAILVLQNLIILLIVFSSAIIALLLSVPGRITRNSAILIVLIPVVLWFSLLTLMFYTSFDRSIGFDLSCSLKVLVIAVLPGISLLYYVRKGANLDRAYSGIFIFIASAAVGSWALQFSCADDSAIHVFVWHFLPLLLIGFLGRFVGLRFLKKI